MSRGKGKLSCFLDVLLSFALIVTTCPIIHERPVFCKPHGYSLMVVKFSVEPIQKDILPCNFLVAAMAATTRPRRGRFLFYNSCFSDVLTIFFHVKRRRVRTEA